MKSEQKKLYDHYLNLSINGTTEIQRINCKGYAEEILKSFPEFKKVPKEVPKVPKEVPKKVPEIKPKEKK